MKALVAAVVLLLTLAGCATVGREVTESQLQGLAKGKTTMDEVVARLGKPTSSASTLEGKRFISYVFAHAQARPESFIPIVGAFVGGTDVRSTMVTFTFDRDGKLEGYVQSQSATGSGTGLAAGEYRAPDRSLPQEAKK